MAMTRSRKLEHLLFLVETGAELHANQKKWLAEQCADDDRLGQRLRFSLRQAAIRRRGA